MSEEGEPRLGNRGFDDAGRAAAARETADRLASAHHGSHTPARTDDEIRARLGPDVRVVSTTGQSPAGAWEQIAERGQLAARGIYPSVGGQYPGYDPDSVESENRRFGPAVSVAKFQ